jgi:anti-anti-sigma factor
VSATAFRMTSVRLPDGTFVVAEGELDLAAGATARSVVGAAARTSDVVEIDLGLVTFIDSAGLRLLAELRDAATEDGYELRIGKRSAVVDRLMTLAGWTTPGPLGVSAAAA